MNYFKSQIKYFNMDGQNYRLGAGVDAIAFTSSYEYGFAYIQLSSGSCILLPNKERFIKFIFEHDYIEPTEVN